MRFLLDTHVLLAIVERQEQRLPGAMRQALAQPHEVFASVASLWELAIKWRLGKLPVALPLLQWPDSIRALGLRLLPVGEHQVLAELNPEPRTKDPFDRLLLGVCAIETLQLLTIDTALVPHPLAWKIAKP